MFSLTTKQLPSNGGINRAGNNERSIRALRMRGPLNPLRFNDLLSGRPTTQVSSAMSLALNAKPFKPRLNEQLFTFASAAR